MCLSVHRDSGHTSVNTAHFSGTGQILTCMVVLWSPVRFTSPRSYVHGNVFIKLMIPNIEITSCESKLETAFGLTCPESKKYFNLGRV